jgi:hypothetical protein
MINYSRLIRFTALYMKLYKDFQIHLVHSGYLSSLSIAQVLLVMYIFQTVRDLPVEIETTFGNCKIFPRSYFICLHKY